MNTATDGSDDAGGVTAFPVSLDVGAKIHALRSDLLTVFTFWCVACNYEHFYIIYHIHLEGPERLPDGFFERPTAIQAVEREVPFRCRLHLRSGVLFYSDDCGHGFAGKSAPMVNYVRAKEY